MFLLILKCTVGVVQFTDEITNNKVRRYHELSRPINSSQLLFFSISVENGSYTYKHHYYNNNNHHHFILLCIKVILCNTSDETVQVSCDAKKKKQKSYPITNQIRSKLRFYSTDCTA